jgi:predicted dehydrogenase
MSAALRIAVVGVGHLGQHHARLLASMDGVQLVGIVDTKPGRAGEIASKLGVPSFTHLGELPLDGLDAVTIAVHTVSHLDVALR